MRILTVTAVAAESDAVLRAAPGEDRPHGLPGGGFVRRAGWGPGDGPPVVDVLAAGVGPAAAAAGTATALTAAGLSGQPYDLVVSAGIGGGFLHAEDGSARPAHDGLVVATEIVAADLGAQTPTGFASVTELGFGNGVHRPPEALAHAVARATGALAAPVLTVSTVTGSAERAAELAARCPGAAVEAMEGFGVAEAAAGHGVPVLEIRAVSNPVGPRDRAAWRIPEALRALTGAFGKMVPVLDGWKERA